MQDEISRHDTLPRGTAVCPSKKARRGFLMFAPDPSIYYAVCSPHRPQSLCPESTIQDYLAWKEENRVQFERPTGLENMGNSCFINSVLQCLAFMPPLAQYFMSIDHAQVLNMFCNSLKLYWEWSWRCWSGWSAPRKEWTR